MLKPQNDGGTRAAGTTGSSATMEPKPTSPAAATGGVAGDGHAVRRRRRRTTTRDASCQTEDAPLGPQEPAPATKRKALEHGASSTRGLEEPSQKKTAKRSGWSGPAGTPLAAPEIQAAAEQFFDTVVKPQRETAAAAAASAGGECSGALPCAAAIMTARPLPLRCPPYPKNGTGEDVDKWNLECRRISSLVAKDPLTKLVKNLPTMREPEDPETVELGAVASSRDKAMVLAAARSIFSVSSVLDGKVICQCTGIVIVLPDGGSRRDGAAACRRDARAAAAGAPEAYARVGPSGGASRMGAAALPPAVSAA
ncbi:hypothetical protein ACP70R_010496 [Stipagrostis hirtigluma subsp. patula]